MNLRESALSWLARFDQAQREVFLASLFLVLLLFVGALGYVLIEGWTWFQGLYMTFITLTTIGFSEVGTLSDPGRVFTIFIAVVGIGSVAFVGARLAQLLLVTGQLRQRHIRHMIARMQNHFILCGFGAVGKRVAQVFRHAGKGLVVIECKDEEIKALAEAGYLYVQGDAEEEEILLEAGIERAYGLIIALPEDSTNVFVTLVARELNPKLFILSRTNDHKNRRKLLHAGADKVVAPDEVGADRMAQVLLRPHVDRFMEQVLHTGALGLLLDEVEVQPGAPLDGKSLADSNFRQEFDAVVIAVIGGQTGEMTFNPDPQVHVQAGDVLIVIGNNEMITRLRAQGCQADAA